jgi:hypothetical protein
MRWKSAFLLMFIGGAGYSLTRFWTDHRPATVPLAMAKMQVYSPAGVRLAAFFDGLPVNPRFRSGELSFAPMPALPVCEKRSWYSPAKSWVAALWGVEVVHAQFDKQCSKTLQYPGSCPKDIHGNSCVPNGYGWCTSFPGCAVIACGTFCCPAPRGDPVSCNCEPQTNYTGACCYGGGGCLGCGCGDNPCYPELCIEGTKRGPKTSGAK